MKFTTKGKIAAGVASTIAGAALVGGLVLAPAAGAKVVDPPAPSVTPGPDHDDGADQVLSWAVESIQQLDAGKLDDTGLRFHAGQEDVTTDADGQFRLCYNDTPIEDDSIKEPAVSTQPGTEQCPEGTVSFPEGYRTQNVSVEGVRSLDGGSFPDGFTTAHHQRNGTVVTALDDGHVMANRELRVTWLAAVTPQATPEQ